MSNRTFILDGSKSKVKKILLGDKFVKYGIKLKLYSKVSKQQLSSSGQLTIIAPPILAISCSAVSFFTEILPGTGSSFAYLS